MNAKEIIEAFAGSEYLGMFVLLAVIFRPLWKFLGRTWKRILREWRIHGLRRLAKKQAIEAAESAISHTVLDSSDWEFHLSLREAENTAAIAHAEAVFSRSYKALKYADKANSLVFEMKMFGEAESDALESHCRSGNSVNDLHIKRTYPYSKDLYVGPPDYKSDKKR